MTPAQVLSDVKAIFVEELDDQSITIGPETTANDVDGWDSLTHIQLVVAIEKHFKIRFTAGEVQRFRNVGEMCERIVAKLAKG
jgi:acyl carrier protein